MTKNAVLVLDLGTSSVRAVLVDAENGATIDRAAISNKWFPGSCGRSEMDADGIWANCQAAVRRILENRNTDCRILAISFSCFGDGLIVVDEDANSIRPMMMAFDVRAQKEAEELSAAVGAERFREITGSACLSMLVCSKLLWMKKNEPEIFRRAAYFLNIQEFILVKLGLEMVTDYTLATRHSMMDIGRKRWSPELMRAVGVDETQLGGAVLEASAIVGRIRRFGEVMLPEEIPVVLGAHDSECAFLGMGIDPRGSNFVANVSGTYEILGCFSSKQPLAAGGTAAGPRSWLLKDPVVELGSGPLKETVLINGSSIAGSYLSWFRKAIYGGRESLYADMERLVRYNGKNPVTFLADNDRSGWQFSGIDASSKTEQLYQAMIEGITYKLKRILAGIELAAGKSFDAVLCGGGGSSSNKWMQFKADLFGKEIRRVRNPETSAVGAAVIAGVGTGFYADYAEAIENMVQPEAVFLPNPEIAQAYESGYQTYLHAAVR